MKLASWIYLTLILQSQWKTTPCLALSPTYGASLGIFLNHSEPFTHVLQEPLFLSYQMSWGY